MAIFSSTMVKVPKRKSKYIRPNPWDREEDFQALKAAISNGRMKPLEQKGMHIDQAAMGEKLGLKDPVRAAADAMRRYIRKLGVQADYWSEKYETQERGVYVLVVTYEPAQSKAKVRKGS